MSNSYAVLGLSKFGYRVAVSLSSMGNKVIVVDRDERIIQKIADSVMKAVCANIMDYEVLEQIGVFSVDTVIIGFRRAFDVAVLLVNHLKRHTDVNTIIAQVDTDEKQEALRLLGVDLTVFPERDRADRLVQQLTMPNLVDHIPLASNAAIIEVPCPKKFEGKSLIELKIRTVYNIYVIGIRHKGASETQQDVLIAPPPDFRFRKGDILILLGDTESLRNFTQDID